ncbi:MAG: HK97 gp10 family phage protein [Bacillota bacterium]
MIKIDDLSKEIAKQLTLYTESVKDEVEQAQDDVTKETVALLKSTSPKGSRGKYAKGWSRKKVDGKWVVYNRTNYHLTHLLEHGHAKRNGGRVAAKVHIRPAEEKAVKEFTDRVEKAVKT